MKIYVFLVICLIGFSLGKYVPSPAGWVEDRCLHRVLKHGDNIVETEDGMVTITNSLEPQRRLSLKPSGCRVFATRRPANETNVGDYDGWLAYTTFQNSQTLDSFLGYFSVPDAPSQDPEVLYLFTGLQNVDWIPIIDPTPRIFDIIQPVLQYPGEGGDYWSVKSWYVTLDSGVLSSNEVRLDVGGTVFGNMTRLSSTTWYIGSTNTATGQTTYITATADRLKSQPWAYNTAECYGCENGGCATLPDNAIQFSKLALYQGGKQVTPTWVTHVSPTPQCHEEAHVQSPSSVSITFQ
jgi:hypothetical protein